MDGPGTSEYTARLICSRCHGCVGSRRTRDWCRTLVSWRVNNLRIWTLLMVIPRALRNSFQHEPYQRHEGEPTDPSAFRRAMASTACQSSRVRLIEHFCLTSSIKVPFCNRGPANRNWTGSAASRIYQQRAFRPTSQRIGSPYSLALPDGPPWYASFIRDCACACMEYGSTQARQHEYDLTSEVWCTFSPSTEPEVHASVH